LNSVFTVFIPFNIYHLQHKKSRISHKKYCMWAFQPVKGAASKGPQWTQSHRFFSMTVDPPGTCSHLHGS
jgi:hypothetical protein